MTKFREIVTAEYTKAKQLSAQRKHCDYMTDWEPVEVEVM